MARKNSNLRPPRGRFGGKIIDTLYLQDPAPSASRVLLLGGGARQSVVYSFAFWALHCERSGHCQRWTHINHN